MKVTTKLDQKAVTSVNLAQSAIASMWLQIRSPVIDWKEAKVMGTHAHYHQRFLIEPCHIKFNITTMNRDGNLPSAHNPLLSYVHTYRPYTEAQHSPASLSSFSSIFIPPSLSVHLPSALVWKQHSQAITAFPPTHPPVVCKQVTMPCT